MDRATDAQYLPLSDHTGRVLPCRLRRLRFLVLLLSALALWTAAPIALAQDAVPPAKDDATPPAKDTIFARKIVMGTIDMNMDEVETMLAPGGKLDDAEAREHLDIISVLLMAFPHMFPAATNQWKAGADRDAALDTFAAPELWTSYGDFYKRATAASKTAFEASRAKQAGDLKRLVAELRSACNSCHASYLKTQ
jgi:cytochrome c556